ncbi:flagellar protein FlaG [Halomonas qaidamensis]|uniref:Flagellar protein FlaG n=1 Tax=Halomonas qaidamensis TaxID=2866211 RepID=A0ABY6JRJ4_9GAMM|nr:flagellar protein FlaG [Halomonas qaidamensis]UYV19207.1 flagellar protein FlaG [Halomonas qaidamensis]
MGPLFIDDLASTASIPYQPMPVQPAHTLKVQSLQPPLSTLTSTLPGTPSSQPNEPSLLSKEALLPPIQRINETLRPRGLEFALSEQSERIITKVIDRETGDVIRQIPAEEVLLVAERLEELQGRLISLEA